MEKLKLIELRKSKGFSQNQIAERLNMDVSNYCRRENGRSKIHIREWENLSKIFEVPLEDIYEADDSQVLICKDNATGNNLGGTSNIYSVPEALLETQQKYIKKLEDEIAFLKCQIK
jgi:transcriptional regulator with XRE-family HTH domain